MHTEVPAQKFYNDEKRNKRSEDPEKIKLMAFSD